MRKCLAIIVMLLFSALLFVPQVNAEIKVGVVDFQKAVELSEDGKKARASFQPKVEKKQRELKAKQDELNKLKEELEMQMQSSLLNKAAQLEKQNDYKTKLRDFQRYYEDAQEELRLEEGKLMEKMLRALQEVIQKLGKAEGFDLILEKSQSAVLYRSDKIDITDKVIEYFNTSKKDPK